jgi:arginyl-tRNA synthetase
MNIFKELKDSKAADMPKAPRGVADAIVQQLPPNDLVVRTEVAGPGFVNVFVSDDVLKRELSSVLSLGLSPPEGTIPKRVVIDFSSPNIAKEMHVGHLRSTIIGEALARTIEFCGHDLLRLNHVGDWGTQFGMLIEHMFDTFPESRQLSDGMSIPVSDLQVFYKAAKARFDTEEEFKKRAQVRVGTLQGGDPTTLAAWKVICDISRKEFQKIYDRLDVTLIERGESFYNPFIPATIAAMEEAGLVSESDGAKCAFFEGSPQPLMVQKSDGGFNYASTDCASIHHRVFTEKANWLVYVTDAGQWSHFSLVFQAAAAMKWTTNVRVDHVGFGVVLGEDGKKFKTRSGEVVRLVELLDEAVARATTALLEHGRGKEMGEDELKHAATAIGYSAVKYADLKNSRVGDYTFSYDRMLDFKGNTAVYLMYAFARVASVLRKSVSKDGDASIDVDALSQTTLEWSHPAERALALHLARFPEIIDTVLTTLQPHHLCEYVYALSDHLNAFYRDVKVLSGDEHQEHRVAMLRVVRIVMKECFHLLGLQPLEKL